MSGPIIFTVTDEDENIRLDTFLSENMEEFTRSFLKKHIEDGSVKLNGRVAKPGVKLKAGDIMEVSEVILKTPDILPENIELNILYEDADIIIVDKPKGMVVHPAAGHYENTLVNALMYHCKGGLSGINGYLRPGIVHRIDMDTSGVLVAAKTDAAHKSLSEQFSRHSINRVYEAIVWGLIKTDKIDIDKPIGRSSSDRKKMAVTEKNSRRAVTHITVIERFKDSTFIEARLETGRTHQIRVHMAHMGHPLLGDIVYGRKKDDYKSLGQALFAKTLGFIHPSTGDYMEFEARRPSYMNNILATLRGGEA